MRILHVINSLSSGGAEKLVFEITQKMSSKDVHIEVLTLTNKKDVYTDELRKLGFVVHTLSSSRSLYNFFAITFLLIRFFRSHSYDLVHVHPFPSFYYISILKRYKIIKCSVIFHEHNTTNNRMDKAYFKRIDEFMYQPYKKIVCISPAVKDALLRHYSICEGKLVVINNGIDLSLCNESKSIDRKQINPTIKDKDILLIMVARFNKQKDHVTLLKAMKLLPEDYKLLLLGEGETENNIKLLSDSLELQNRVFFLGYKHNVYDYIKTSDIFVLSSIFEGFGLVCVEAMACGVPVIVSNVPGMSSVVGEVGMTFTVGNEMELCSRINELWKNQTLYRQKSKMGLDRSKLFSLQAMIEKLHELYVGNYESKKNN